MQVWIHCFAETGVRHFASLTGFKIRRTSSCWYEVGEMEGEGKGEGEGGLLLIKVIRFV